MQNVSAMTTIRLTTKASKASSSDHGGFDVSGKPPFLARKFDDRRLGEGQLWLRTRMSLRR